MNTNIKLFLIFSKLGLMVIGGGYAIYFIMMREIVDNKKWLAENELMDYYILAQTMPGLITVNFAALLGHYKNGFLGAISCVLGIVFAPIIIIILIAIMLSNSDHYVINKFLNGVMVGVVAMVINSVCIQTKRHVKNIYHILIFILAFILLIVFQISPVIIVLINMFLALICLKVKS